ncbi:MAG: efflux transporter outer membrane subunit [Sphingomonas sp.]|nr:efflux transporter outer membrane subunit [Sphingomonas sp.]
MKRTLVALSGAATLLAGCTVGPNYQRPELALPATYARSAEAPGSGIDPATWWTAFGDARLTALIEKGLAGNPDIAVAASRVRSARLQEIVARAAGKPAINAAAQASRVEFSKNAGFASLARLFAGGGTGGSGVAAPGSGISTVALGFDASWEIDLFGGDRRGVEAARARGEGALWSGRDAAITLAAEIADAYFALRLDQEQIAIIERQAVDQRRGLEIAGNIARAGLTPNIDVVRQRGSLSSTLARVEPLKADVEVRIHALGILTGQPPEALLADLTARGQALSAPPVVPAGLPSDLLRRRPDIRAAERDLAAATADIGVAVSNLYPKFSLTGAAQLLSSSLTNLVSSNSIQANAAASATFPILDWGRRKANVGLAKEAREQAYQRYQATVLGALRDVEDPLSRIDAERRRNAVLQQALADAERTAGAVEAQYRTGFVAQDSLINAQVQVLTAREQLAASDGLLRQQTAALFKAIGGGWAGPIS